MRITHIITAALITAALPLLWLLLLLQSAYASNNGTVTGITAAWITQYKYLGDVVVDGPNITVLSEVIYNTSNASEVSGIARLRKPLFNNMSGFAVNESGALIPVSDLGQELEWRGNFSRKTYLLFDIPQPKKATLSVVSTSEFYRKEVAVYSGNYFDSANMSLPVNLLADNWSLYELQNGSWADVSSVYNFSVVKRLARISGFSPSGKVFMIEGYSPSYSYVPRAHYLYEDEGLSGSSASSSSSGGNGGGSGSSGSAQAQAQAQASGSSASSSASSNQTGVSQTGSKTGSEEWLDLGIDAPDAVESGEFYGVSVFALSKKSEPINLTLLLEGFRQNLSLEPLKEKSVSFRLRAPMANGSFAITAEAGNASASKRIGLDFKPLRLDAGNATMDGKQWILVSADAYGPGLAIDITIYKDGETLYSDAVSGMSYSSRIMVKELGNYTVVATATNADGRVVDTDVAELQLATGRYDEPILPMFLVAFAYAAIVAIAAFVFMSKSDR